MFSESAPTQTTGKQAVQRRSSSGPTSAPRSKELPKDVKAQVVSLEDLVAKPGKLDGQIDSRGGEVPRPEPLRRPARRAASATRADWVIKDDLYAVWVTRPASRRARAGSSTPKLKRDTGKWIEVVGRPDHDRRRHLHQALMRVRSALRPSPPPRPRRRPRRPSGRRCRRWWCSRCRSTASARCRATGRFVVQFSKDMDEESFKGRVLLRYAGRPQPGRPRLRRRAR